MSATGSLWLANWLASICYNYYIGISYATIFMLSLINLLHRNYYGTKLISSTAFMTVSRLRLEELLHTHSDCSSESFSFTPAISSSNASIYFLSNSISSRLLRNCRCRGR
jgi:hypothetical protein